MELLQADLARQKFGEAWKAYVRANPPDKDTTHACSIDQDMLDIFGLNDADDTPADAEGPAAAAGAGDHDQAATPHA